jgi:hypothetical protein
MSEFTGLYTVEDNGENFSTWSKHEATRGDVLAAVRKLRGVEEVESGYDGRELHTGAQLLELGRYLIVPLDTGDTG